MYSINVFLTFSLSEFGMVKHFILHRRTRKSRFAEHRRPGHRLRPLRLHPLPDRLEKFTEGGWLTSSSRLPHRPLRDREAPLSRVGSRAQEARLARRGRGPGNGPKQALARSTRGMTAIQLVSGYNGIGVHSFLQSARPFPTTTGTSSSSPSGSSTRRCSRTARACPSS